MAHFYGNLKGSRGAATRCGTARSGLTVSARSWKGSVTVEMRETDSGTWCRILASEGSSVGGNVLFSGRISELATAVRLMPQEDCK